MNLPSLGSMGPHESRGTCNSSLKDTLRDELGVVCQVQGFVILSCRKCLASCLYSQCSLHLLI